MFNFVKSLYSILAHPLNSGKFLRTVGRVFWWKYNQLFVKVPAVIEIENGVMCLCYPDSSYGGLVVYKKLPEYNEMSYIINNLKKDDVFIDIGANIGAISLLAASRVGKSGRVYSFEPNQFVLPRLIENINLNNFGSIVEISDNAVSKKLSRVSFVNETTSETSHISYSGKQNPKGKMVKSITLNKFLNDKGVNKVKMLKIDVEGAELDVLKGCVGSFHKIDTIIVELNVNSERYGNSKEETFDFILNQGYKIYSFIKNGKLKRLSDVPNQNVTNVLAIR